MKIVLFKKFISSYVNLVNEVINEYDITFNKCATYKRSK